MHYNWRMFGEAQRDRRIFWLGIILLAVFKLWLVNGQTLIANPQYAHDDALFIRLAENLVQGEWLGPYDNLTLVKGPFYPLWIALSFKLSLPLLLSQHLLYIFACMVFVLALRRGDTPLLHNSLSYTPW